MISLRRGAVAAVVALTVVASLAGCGETQKDSNYAPVADREYNPVNGENFDSTIVNIRDLYLLNKVGPVPPRLRMVLVNTTLTPDTLVRVAAGNPFIPGKILGGTRLGLPVLPGTSVGVGNGGAQVVFQNLTVQSGSWVPVELIFRNGRTVIGSILVQNGASQYSDGTLPTIPAIGPQAPAVVPTAGTTATPAGNPGQG